MKKCISVLLVLVVVLGLGLMGCSKKDTSPINLEDYYTVKFMDSSGIKKGTYTVVVERNDALGEEIIKRTGLDVSDFGDYMTYSMILESITERPVPSGTIYEPQNVILTVTINDEAYLKEQGLVMVGFEKEFEFVPEVK